MPQLLPLHSSYAAMGASLGEVHDWLLPMRFADPVEEVNAVRQAAGILDLSMSTVLEMRGEDSRRFLHRMVTNDIERLSPGEGCRAALLEHKGHLLSDLRVLRLTNSLLLLAPAVTGRTVREFLEHHIVADRVEIRDLTADNMLLSVQGPLASEVVRRMTDRPAEGGALHTHFERILDGKPIRLIRSDHTGESGFDVLTEASYYAPRLLDRLLDAGHELGIRPVGYQAWNVLRIESGIPWYGVDMDSSNLIQELPMEDAVSYSKGCYVGQETVARVHARGHVNRLLCGIRLDGAQFPAAGDRFLAGGEEAGRITSSAFSTSLGCAIAMGFIRREYFERGRAVSVLSGDHALEGTVVSLPFFPASD
jgi:folate-binding protein YgfZ